MSALKLRLKAYAHLIRLDKPVGTLLLLWPMLIALWVSSEGVPSWRVLGVFVAGCFLMRSAGCAINDFADREFDGHVARTQNRVLPQGLISAYEAVAISGLLALIAFALCFLTNLYVVKLSVIGAALTLVYPFLKRVTHMPQFILGAAFAWAIPMSYAATVGVIPLESWLLYSATLLWAVAYDTIYALVDKEDDLKLGVRSTAILFGTYAKPIIVLCYVLVTLLLGLYAYYAHYLSVSVILSLTVGLALVASWSTKLQESNPEACFKVFKENPWLGFIWFLGFAVQTLFKI